MLALFTWFTATKLGREVGIALLILALIAGVYWKGHAVGFQSGHAAGGKETFDQLRQGMNEERAKTKDALAALDSRIQAKDQVIASQQQVVDSQKIQFATLSAQQAAVERQISVLTDAQVVLDLASRLGVRAAGDQTPTLYPQELRKADEVVGQFPVVSSKVDNLQRSVEAQGKQIVALTDKVTLTDEKFKTAMNYIEQSDQRFKNAYNVFESLHGRPWWQKALTFGILQNKKITKLTLIEPLVKPTVLK